MVIEEIQDIKEEFKGLVKVVSESKQMQKTEDRIAKEEEEKKKKEELERIAKEEEEKKKLAGTSNFSSDSLIMKILN